MLPSSSITCEFSVWLYAHNHNSPHRIAVEEKLWIWLISPHMSLIKLMQASAAPCPKKSRKPKSGKHYTLATLMKKAILLNEATIRLHAVQYKKRVIFVSQEGFPELAKHIHNETSCTPGDKQSPKTIEEVGSERERKKEKASSAYWKSLNCACWVAAVSSNAAHSSCLIYHSQKRGGGWRPCWVYCISKHTRQSTAHCLLFTPRLPAHCPCTRVMREWPR